MGIAGSRWQGRRKRLPHWAERSQFRPGNGEWVWKRDGLEIGKAIGDTLAVWVGRGEDLRWRPGFAGVSAPRRCCLLIRPPTV